MLNNATTVPKADIDSNVIDTGDLYPGFKYDLSGTPVGTYTDKKFTR